MKKNLNRIRTTPLILKLLISNSIIILTLVLVMLSGREVISGKMENFLTTRFEEQVDELVVAAQQLLASSASESDFRQVLGIQFSRRGYLFKVYNTDHALVYSNEKKMPDLDNWGAEGASGLKQGLDQPEIDKFRPDELSVKTETRDLYTQVDGEKVYLGYTEISYVMVNNFSPEDAEFLKQFLYLYQIMIVISIVIAGLLSFIVSRSITKPIKKVIRITESIQAGNLDQRVDIRTRTRELVELKDSINYLAESLEDEDRLRKQMTSDMAHEIRTPVNNVQNILEAMIDGVWEADLDNLNKCRREILRINNLVDELKSIAVIEEANLYQKNEIYDLSGQVRDVLDLFKVKAGKKGVSLLYKGPKELSIYMDPAKMAQILANLISNSIRYSFDNTEVVIAVEPSNHEDLIIKVIDQGIGIEEDHINRVFERFYRTDESRNKETGGLGLGLTIVKQLIKLYNGAISVESQVNKGSEFIVSLPGIIR